MSTIPQRDKESVASLRQQVIELARSRGYERREEPFKLASGQFSHDYIDGKYAVDTGDRLALVSKVAIETVHNLGIDFNTVGGLTMGADALAHGIAIVGSCAWFSVRKEPKSRGRAQWIEGCRLDSKHRVLLVDDVISTGGSILQAYQRVRETGASVVGVVTLVDRGDMGRQSFEELGIPYAALVTYNDLGIEPVSG